jgi:hypothetical protein
LIRAFRAVARTKKSAAEIPPREQSEQPDYFFLADFLAVFFAAFFAGAFLAAGFFLATGMTIS